MPRSATLPQVELARVLAMSAIFLFHLWSVVPDGVGGPVSVALSQGHLGVVVFDVITGLVLAWPHFGPAGRPLPSWGEFLHRRFLRIVPAYYLALALWIEVAMVAAWSAPGHRQFPSAGGIATHVLFVHTLSPAHFFAIVPAYWWLGLLAQLYLAFPLLLRLRRASAAGFAVVCAASWAIWLLVDALARARPQSTIALVNYLGYYNLPYRLPEFAIGIALAGMLRSDDAGVPRLPPATAAVLLPLCGLVALMPRPSAAPLVHIGLVAACTGLLMALLALPSASRVGSVAIVRSLAAASFSFYLLHQPILGYGSEALAAAVGPRSRFLMLLAGAGLLTFALSLVLDRLAARIAAYLDGTART